MRTRVLAAVCLMTGVIGATARADDKPIPRPDIDVWAASTAYEAAKYGTELFNAGNHEGCYRIYQATLVAVYPLLDHRPKLVEVARDRLAKAVPLKAAEAAAVLREAIDAIQSETSQALIPPKKPLWERLGGEKVVRVVVHDFVAAAVKDPKVNFSRDGKYKLDEKGLARLEELLVQQVSAVGGGPLKYTGRNMAEVHKGMKITDEEFRAIGNVLSSTLLKHNVPTGEVLELIVILQSTKPDIVGK